VARAVALDHLRVEPRPRVFWMVLEDLVEGGKGLVAAAEAEQGDGMVGSRREVVRVLCEDGFDLAKRVLELSRIPEYLREAEAQV
jgi:hypothetical protein